MKEEKEDENSPRTPADNPEVILEGLPTPELNEHILLNGTEKFLRTTEMISHFILGLKQYNKHNESMLTRISIDVERRVLNQEFAEYKAAREELVNEKVKKVEVKFTEMLREQEEAFNTKL